MRSGFVGFGRSHPKGNGENLHVDQEGGVDPRRPFDPLRPAPMEPPTGPFRPPGQYLQPRNDELARMLKEILDRLTAMENRLKAIEEALKTRR